MIKEILHVRSRCGGGKSQETITELVDHLLAPATVEHTYLFASRTNDLTHQNCKAAQDAVRKHTSGRALPIQRIDSTNNKGTVVKDLANLVSTGFKGIVFISHSTLASMPSEVLNGKKVVVDEVPQELVGCLMVRHAARDHGYPWDKYLHEVASSHPGYTSVEIHPTADRDDIHRYISAIRQQKDTATTHSVADLLDFLLQGYEAVYTTTTQSDGSSTRLYQAVHYHRLKELAKQIDFLAILSAQLKDTLFGYIAQHHLGLPIVERDINKDVTLVQKHKNRVRIIPFLKAGRWSTSLKMKSANSALTRNFQPVQSNAQVRVFAQEFADKILKNEDFLITLNQDDKLLDSLDRPGVTLTSTAVHGMNHLRHLDHAAYLASTNPTPFDNKSLRMFAKDRSLNGEELFDAVIVERCYETAYQCVARTSIRDKKHNPAKEHIIIVPDLDYAIYLADWFEASCATIDTQYSFTTMYEDEQSNKRENRKNIVTHILTEQSLKKEKLQDLIKKAGISRSTFRRYKEEFRQELEPEGLLKPKRVNTNITIN